MKPIISIFPPQISPVDFKTVTPGTISWSSSTKAEGMTSEEAREMARRLLEAADELDAINGGLP